MGCLTFSGEGRKSLGFCFYGLEKLFFFFFFRLFLSFFVVDQKSCFSGFICLFFVCCKFYCPLLLCLDYCMDSLFSLYCLKKGAQLFMKGLGCGCLRQTSVQVRQWTDIHYKYRARAHLQLNHHITKQQLIFHNILNNLNPLLHE